MEIEKRNIFYIILSVWILLVLLLIAIKIFHLPWHQYTIPCLFHLLTGYYCPGCGGTRAVFFLFHGNLLRSLYYHPLVVYVTVLSLWFLLDEGLSLWKPDWWKRCRIHFPYTKKLLWFGGFLLFFHLISKNLTYFLFGISLI